jgi:hypothetical protein
MKKKDQETPATREAEPTDAAALGAAPAETVFNMPIEKLRTNVAAAMDYLDQIKALLPGMLTLTNEDRRNSSGKFRDGETRGFYDLIQFAIANPQYFDGLADRDQGQDPTRFEPELIRDRLERRDLLAQFAPPAEELGIKANDSVLHLGDLTKPVLSAAYGIARVLAKHNEVVRSSIAKLIDFYGGVARRAAETRARNAAAENKPSEPSPSK